MVQVAVCVSDRAKMEQRGVGVWSVEAPPLDPSRHPDCSLCCCGETPRPKAALTMVPEGSIIALSARCISSNKPHLPKVPQPSPPNSTTDRGTKCSIPAPGHFPCKLPCHVTLGTVLGLTVSTQGVILPFQRMSEATYTACNALGQGF